MGIREGVGLVEPAPVRLELSAGELAWLGALARRRDAYRGYGRRADAWGRGFRPDATLAGLVGEWAAVGHLNRTLRPVPPLAVDESDRPRGDDGYDLLVYGVRVQVKCSQRCDRLLVRRETEGGRVKPARFDCVLVCSWPGVPDPAQFRVLIHGWVSRADLMEYGEFVGAERGRHKNLRIEARRLGAVSDLVDHLRVQRILRSMP